MSNLQFSQENYCSNLAVFLSRNCHFLEQVAAKEKHQNRVAMIQSPSYGVEGHC